MISAWWLLPAIWMGAAGGYIAAAMLFTARNADEKEE